MTQKFKLLLCLSALLSVFTASARPTQMNLWSAVTKDGQITLEKDSLGFYVSVDFQYNPTDASDSEADDPSIGSMSLALYTSHTILSQSCLEYDTYPCTTYGCSPYTSWTSNISLPYFIANGYFVNAQVYLDYDNWVLHNYATVATNCPSNVTYSYGNGRYGLLGLGFNTSQVNFINSNVFSISLDRSGASGTLLFASNSNVTASSRNVATLTADSNWHVAAKNTVIKIGDTEITISARIIFDLDAVAIGLPLSIFQEFLTNFQTANPNVPCNNPNSKPTCSYNGRIGDLKKIKMTIQGQEIEIPPTLYAEGLTDPDISIDSSFTLNFQALDTTLTDSSYVTPAYENYIVLDQNFLSFYYAEFTADNTEYSINLQTVNSTSMGSSPVWPYIVGGIGGFFLLAITICCICGCVKRRRERRRKAASRVAQSVDVNPSDQAPLINDQTNNNSYQANMYYPPQNYHQPDVYSGYPQQIQNPPPGYGNLPGYTYVPQQGGAYPYLPPVQGQMYGNVAQNNVVQRGVQERGQGAE